MPAMLQQVSGGKRRYTIDPVAVVRVCGEKAAPWKVMENVGIRPVNTRDVGILIPRKIKSKEVWRGCREREASQGQWQHESPAREPGSTWSK